MLLFIPASLNMIAQDESYKFDFGVNLGVSGYLGDANAGNMFSRPGFSGALTWRYLANQRIAVKASAGLSTISGDTSDFDNAMPSGENFKFSSTLYSLGVSGEFNFLPYGIGPTYQRLSRWTPYLSLGIGMTVASSGGTTSVSPSLPMGIGVKYMLRPRLSVSMEFDMVKTFTDKLDGNSLNDPYGIKSSFAKNTDWYSFITVGVSYEFGKRCPTCHYVE